MLMLTDVRALGHCVDDHLLAISRTAFIDTAGNVNFCITFADSQTFYQRYVFNGNNTHISTLCLKKTGPLLPFAIIPTVLVQ